MILDKSDKIAIKIYNFICLKIIAVFIIILLIIISIMDGKLNLDEIFESKNDIIDHIKEDYINDQSG